MNTLCNANCGKCLFNENCKGCSETCGSPFGGRCIAAEYIKVGGLQQYQVMKENLKDEINQLLTTLDLPLADDLYELKGEFVNLAYPMPNGKTVQLLKDENIYLGTQIEFADRGICYGVIADTAFILICSYSVNGSEPELICFQKR